VAMMTRIMIGVEMILRREFSKSGNGDEKEA
jgi:hypothetical protein